ncbi:hypothetical protein [Actinomadura sp. NAK00032]|nr:hypothetical protein [Actinomadura sp. NAK00032]
MRGASRSARSIASITCLNGSGPVARGSIFLRGFGHAESSD